MCNVYLSAKVGMEIKMKPETRMKADRSMGGMAQIRCSTVVYPPSCGINRFR